MISRQIVTKIIDIIPSELSPTITEKLQTSCYIGYCNDQDGIMIEAEPFFYLSNRIIKDITQFTVKFYATFIKPKSGMKVSFMIQTIEYPIVYGFLHEKIRVCAELSEESKALTVGKQVQALIQQVNFDGYMFNCNCQLIE